MRALDRLPDAVLLARLDGRIVWANRAFGALVGSPPARLEGRLYADLVPEDERPEVGRVFARLAEGGTSGRLSGRLLAGGGWQQRLDWSISALPEEGLVLGIGRCLGAGPPDDQLNSDPQRHLAAAIGQMVEGFALFDANDRLIHCNRRFRDLYGSLSTGARAGVSFADLTRELAYSGIVVEARGREEQWILERMTWHRDPPGVLLLKLVDGRWIQIDEQRTCEGGIVLLRTDVTAIKHREQAYALFAAALDQSGDVIELLDADHRLIYVNPAFSRLTGYTPSQVLGRYAPDFLRDELDPTLSGRIGASLRAGEVWSGRLRARIRQGALIHQDTTISPLRDGDGRVTHFVVVKRDVTSQIEAEDRIHHLAHHDALTDLPNRALFRDRLRQALAETRRTGERRALLFLDLDHFKDINDTLGHAIGDAFLVAVAGRLKACVRDADTVCRLGGDEFAVLQAHPDGASGAASLARRIIATLAEPFLIDGQELHTSASVGITVIPDDGDDAGQLLKQADLALYRAKSEGRDNFQFFLPDFRQALEARTALERDLRHALKTDGLSLDFQPLVDLETLSIRSMEALLRWHHPERGAVPPQTFIQVAEESGLVVPLTAWVLQTACRAARAWQDQGLAPVRIAVNLSAVQFRHRGLVGMVDEALRESGLASRYLELEITERVLVHDPDRALDIMRRLAALGVELSMDDFGTGYSSLSSLRRFPLHKIKIDRSFVREVITNPESAAIIKAIIGLGKSLQIRVTAEGVETEEQLKSLRTDGCEEVQGYLLARPMPAPAIPAFLRASLTAALGGAGEALAPSGQTKAPGDRRSVPVA